MAEFATKSNNSLSIRLSPFFVLKDLHSCMSFDIVDLSDITTCEWIHKKKAIDISEAI